MKEGNVSVRLMWLCQASKCGMVFSSLPLSSAVR